MKNGIDWPDAWEGIPVIFQEVSYNSEGLVKISIGSPNDEEESDMHSWLPQVGLGTDRHLADVLHLHFIAPVYYHYDTGQWEEDLSIVSVQFRALIDAESRLIEEELDDGCIDFANAAEQLNSMLGDLEGCKAVVRAALRRIETGNSSEAPN